VSGGHTLLLHATDWGAYRLLGQTRDDAAGEAFDKVAKLLGLRYPGGPEIERLAGSGDAGRHRLPRPMLARNQRPGSPDYYDFSFSGLKTAVVELVRSLEAEGRLDEERPHVAAAFQEAAIDVLASKTMRAVDQTGCHRVLLGGGVSANGGLRRELERRLGDGGRLFVSTPRLALDNGAMVARAARYRFEMGDLAAEDTSASASLSFPGLVPSR
jgi:N6-L-threonylcarbamoyladenine synthase